MILAVVQSSAVLFLALCAVLISRRLSAAMRHAILTAGLASSLAVPFLSSVWPESLFPRSAGLYERVYEKAETIQRLNLDTTPIPASVSTAAPIVSRAVRWVWIAGMAIAGTLLITGVVRIVLLVFRSKLFVQTEWMAESQVVAQYLGIQRRIRLRQNDCAVLGTWGILRPTVFLPRDANRWPKERIRVVLTHELAHVRRFDWPLQILAEIARGVYWFNPLFWLACRWLRFESEHACDDVVLSAGFNSNDYAAHLLELARDLNHRGGASVLAMSRPPNLERRFVAMLNPSLNRRSLTRATLLGICVMTICVSLPLAAMRAPRQPTNAGPSPIPLVKVEAAAADTVSVQTGGVNKLVRIRSSRPRMVAPVSTAAESKPAPAVPIQGLADGTLEGTVSDGSGAFVPGVRLTVTRIDQGSVGEQATTDEAGRYRFPLPAGMYLVTAELPGFTSVARRVEVKTSETSRLNIGLSVGSIVQTVVVSAAGQPRPKPLPTSPQRIRIGGVVQAANLISQVKPIYPPNARDAGIEGTVQLQGIIGVEGTLIGLRVLSSNDPDLAAAATESVRQWRYRPTMLNGSPIEVITDISVRFELQ